MVTEPHERDRNEDNDVVGATANDETYQIGVSSGMASNIESCDADGPSPLNTNVDTSGLVSYSTKTSVVVKLSKSAELRQRQREEEEKKCENVFLVDLWLLLQIILKWRRLGIMNSPEVEMDK